MSNQCCRCGLDTNETIPTAHHCIAALQDENKQLQQDYELAIKCIVDSQAKAAEKSILERLRKDIFDD